MNDLHAIAALFVLNDIPLPITRFALLPTSNGVDLALTIDMGDCSALERNKLIEGFGASSQDLRMARKGIWWLLHYERSMIAPLPLGSASQHPLSGYDSSIPDHAAFVLLKSVSFDQAD